MAENDEYYKEIVEKQQELLNTLISPKRNMIIHLKLQTFKNGSLPFNMQLHQLGCSWGPSKDNCQRSKQN